MTKDDLQAIADLLKPIQEDLQTVKKETDKIPNIENRLAKIELKIEHEIDRAIKTIGEGHLDLNQKLIEKISIDNRVEMLEHKVSALEYVVRK